MANLTLTVEDHVLRRARIRALEQGTSVNALVREYLGAFAGESSPGDGVRSFLALTDASSTGSGEEGRTWTRDSAHER